MSCTNFNQFVSFSRALLYGFIDSLTTFETVGIGLKMKNKTLQIAEVLSEGAAFEDGFLGVKAMSESV